MLSGRDIVIISSIDWRSNWQGHQEIARRLAGAGNRVLYIENMGVRAPGLQDAGRVVARAANWLRAFPGGVREVLPNLHVCAPVVLPPFGSSLRQQINRRLLVPLVRRAVRRLGFTACVVISYLPTDTAMALIELLREPGGLIVYYCIADFAELTPHALAMMTSERALVETSDVVFAQCDELAQRCEKGDRPVGIFPFGVNIELFATAIEEKTVIHDSDLAAVSARSLPLSTLLSSLPRPLVGYVGGLHRHFDLQMLATMATARPQWSWVLIGPTEIRLDALTGLSNVHVCGARPHHELPRYIRSFDVGIVPYVHNSYTTTVVPTKINEYLAMGKPVVSTDLPEVTAFNRRHDVLVTSTNQASAFLSAIERALQGSTPAAIARRRDVALENDWESRLEQMSTVIETEARLKS